jgi:hypothetical protein
LASTLHQPGRAAVVGGRLVDEERAQRRVEQRQGITDDVESVMASSAY